MASVKNKIRLGSVFLFFLVVATGTFTIYYLSRIKTESQNVLKANYESIQYAHSMQRSLDSIIANKRYFLDSFAYDLESQEKNITEPGEREATANLRRAFDRLDTARVRFELQRILQLNMVALKNKNEKAEKLIEDATTFLILVVAVIFLVGLSFAFNFPSIVTDPIQRLTAGIQEIGQKNYAYRIHIESKDEFGALADSFNKMAERLEFFENSSLNKLIFEKTRAEAVINSLKDPSIGIDKNNNVLFVNQQALQLLGIRAEDAVGKSTADVSSRNDLFKFLIANDSNNPFKVVLDGKENYYVKEAMDVSQGETSNKVIVLRNITSFKELDVAKTDFIATVSHELKTPLASSDFSLKLLEDSRTSEKEKGELVAQLKSDNQRMLRILSELLNMSQVEAGKIQLDIQSVNPYRIIESSENAVLIAAREKEVTIKKSIERELPNIMVDADKTTWVLNNFLTNAIKFAPAKSEVTIECKRAENRLSFSVADHGQGIDELYIDRIFERYFQVPGRSDKKGSGIGLAICKDFIDAMKGRIWVKSRIGEGSTFGFDVPVDTNVAG